MSDYPHNPFSATDPQQHPVSDHSPVAPVAVRGPNNSIEELIGATPLLRIAKNHLPNHIRLYAKLEFCNPGGSVKDRTAALMISCAERQGLLKPGGVIIEATAGNMGLGIAAATAGKDYRLIFVVPTKFSSEKQTLLKAMGAEVINTPRAQGMRGATAKANRLLLEIPEAISLRQFENPANPLAHYYHTGPEIWQALQGQIDYLVAGAGSGGTFSGITRYLKEQNPGVQGILADPEGSTIGGGEHAEYDIEGIGNDFVPLTLDMALVDAVIKVRDTEALACVQQLAREDRLIVGSSSGAAVWAALQLAQDLARATSTRQLRTSTDDTKPRITPKRDGAPGSRITPKRDGAPPNNASARTSRTLNIVAVLPDRGDRYFSKLIFG
ncbi:MAG: cysteine synthase family protein [Coriobacteriales bacterium]|nr:cysteine synthase family protein [Coriobacteriales bacterium]